MVTTQPDNESLSKIRELALSDEDFNALHTIARLFPDRQDDLPAGVN